MFNDRDIVNLVLKDCFAVVCALIKSLFFAAN